MIPAIVKSKPSSFLSQKRLDPSCVPVDVEVPHTALQGAKLESDSHESNLLQDLLKGKEPLPCQQARDPEHHWKCEFDRTSRTARGRCGRLGSLILADYAAYSRRRAAEAKSNGPV